MGWGRPWSWSAARNASGGRGIAGLIWFPSVVLWAEWHAEFVLTCRADDVAENKARPALSFGGDAT